QIVCTSFSSNSAASAVYSTLSLHDALPISTAPAFRSAVRSPVAKAACRPAPASAGNRQAPTARLSSGADSHSTASEVSTQMKRRSEEHTSELQSRENLVCRLLLEKKK